MVEPVAAGHVIGVLLREPLQRTAVGVAHTSRRDTEKEPDAEASNKRNKIHESAPVAQVKFRILFHAAASQRRLRNITTLSFTNC
jgi:hypothetical protein